LSGIMPVAGQAGFLGGRAAVQDRCRWGDRPRRPRCRHGAERPVASGASIKLGEPLHREARAALDAGDVPRPLTCRAAASAPTPVMQSAERPLVPGMVASGASIKPGDRERVWVRITARTVEVFHRSQRVAAHLRSSSERPTPRSPRNCRRAIAAPIGRRSASRARPARSGPTPRR
jgi:hypothetical protein